MIVRTLVVDDYDAWRRFVSAAVRKNPRCQIVGELADGLEAVQVAERLKPDLIVLDVGLPTLNGIEAARRIRKLVPDAKILFVSEHRSRDVVDAALVTGAYGYVLKSDAGDDLAPAIDSVIDGKPYTSASVGGFAAARLKGESISKSRCRHELALCSDEMFALDGMARFTDEALRAGGVALVFTAGARRELVHERLRARNSDIDTAIAEGRYRWFDASDVLSAIIVNDWPDEGRFLRASADLLAAVSASKPAGARISACGECAAILWRAGNMHAAIRLERLWDDFARAHDMDLWCGYSLRPPLDRASQIVQRLCAEHSAIHSA